MKESGDPYNNQPAPVIASGDRTFSPSDNNFDFAFNSSNFSDRVLQIEIVADRPETIGCVESDDDLNERGYLLEHTCEVEGGVQEKDTALSGESPIADGRLGGDLETNGTACSINLSQVIRIKTVYISSAILASKSPFFYKLFSNGMKESDQRHATIRISESEEDSFMELLGFIYSGNLNTMSPDLLLDVLIAADKFEVASCMRHCCHLLRSLPMTRESALIYLDLPSNISVASAVQSLTDAARLFLANTYRDITKFQEEVMTLPLAGIEAILSSNDLQVASEDAVFDFVLKWARVHYPILEERREIIGSRLLQHVRFPHMTCRKLRKVLSCADLDSALVSKVVTEALFFKADAPHRQRALAADVSNRGQFTERAYKYRPLKVVEFDRPHPQCIVYLDLKREECAKLFPSGRVYSQAFQLGGQGFFLSAHCNMDQQSSFHCFGLFLGMQEKGTVSFSVDYEFAARTSLSGDFISKYKGCYTFTGGKAVGYRNLFGIPWASFIAEDSHSFIDGVLHLRAELTIKKPPQPSLLSYVG